MHGPAVRGPRPPRLQLKSSQHPCLIPPCSLPRACGLMPASAPLPYNEARRPTPLGSCAGLAASSRVFSCSFLWCQRLCLATQALEIAPVATCGHVGDSLMWENNPCYTPWWLGARSMRSRTSSYVLTTPTKVSSLLPAAASSV